jgi:hypothetical protein
MLLLEHRCDIARDTAVGTNGRRQMQTVHTAVPCLATPMVGTATAQNGFDLGKAYDFYFDLTADVKVKDRLTCGGTDYTVSSVLLYNVPRVGHLHVLAQMEIGS